jgi:hypothetical protein
MAETPSSPELRTKPVGEVVDDVMKQSQDLLQRGAAVTAEVNELRRRADDALDWRKQLRTHTGLAAGVAFVATVLVVLAFSSSD